MAWFWDHYAPEALARQHPDAAPLRAPVLSGLPPGRRHDRRARRAAGRGRAVRDPADEGGVPVRFRRFDGADARLLHHGRHAARQRRGPRVRRRRRGRAARRPPGEPMSRRDLIDPELRPPLDQLLAVMPGGFNAIPDIVQRRGALEQLGLAQELPPNPAVAISEQAVPGPAGAPDITLRIYRPVNAPSPRPGIYYIHGGGMILGSAAGEDWSASTVLRAARRHRGVGRVPAGPGEPPPGSGRGLLRRPGVDGAQRRRAGHRPGPAGHLRGQRGRRADHRHGPDGPGQGLSGDQVPDADLPDDRPPA